MAGMQVTPAVVATAATVISIHFAMESPDGVAPAVLREVVRTEYHDAKGNLVEVTLVGQNCPAALQNAINAEMTAQQQQANAAVA